MVASVAIALCRFDIFGSHATLLYQGGNVASPQLELGRRLESIINICKRKGNSTIMLRVSRSTSPGLDLDLDAAADPDVLRPLGAMVGERCR